MDSTWVCSSTTGIMTAVIGMVGHLVRTGVDGQHMDLRQDSWHGLSGPPLLWTSETRAAEKQELTLRWPRTWASSSSWWASVGYHCRHRV